jgi:gluconate:H+ symporter, GntP family
MNIFLLSIVLLSILAIILLTSVFKQNTFLSMFVVALTLGVALLPAKEVVPVIAQGFGDTMKSIGVIIILGIMIGQLLEKTGATASMANSILRLTGKHNSGLAIGLTGFVAGIPIFCNSGFIVLSGINKSLVKATGKPMIFMATMLAAGLYSIHCMIPPHPGAMAAVGIVKPNIGYLILLGIFIALPAAFAGFGWAKWMTRKEHIVLNNTTATEEVNTFETDFPSPFWSFMPILVPLILLTGKSIIMLYQPPMEIWWVKIITLIGSPEVALLLGVFIALSLFKKIEKDKINSLFDEAIEKAGPILVLTAAGGIYGAVIKATGIGEQTGTYLAATGLGLFIPFFITSFLKTAQGSSTVAIMTAASIVAPMLPALYLDTEAGKLLATLAMGAGSMSISHANDSYFWVVAKFSGLETNATLKVYSSTTLVMGCVAFLCVWIASLFLL